MSDPLAQLHDIAARLGVTVVEGSPEADLWSTHSTAACVSLGEHITLSPRLRGNDLRADVLAMALIVAAVMGDADIGHPCAITAPGGLVVISSTRVMRPGFGPGKLATLLARKCGRDTASAAFAYAVHAADLGTTSMHRGRPVIPQERSAPCMVAVRGVECCDQRPGVA